MKDWEFSVGFYPGILFGLRTYAEVNQKNYVFYLPFIDFCITIK
jgi:hypothetical protein